MSHYPIQQGLWESIDAILFNKAMALAKDVAAELNLPAQALIDILKKEERSKFTILPDDDMTYQCQALIHQGAIYTRCRCPTLGVAQLCSNHNTTLYHIPPSSVALPTVQRYVTPDSTNVMCHDSQIYTMSGKQCGYLKGVTITLFEIEEV